MKERSATHGWICLRGIEVDGMRVGVLPEEQHRLQRVKVDVQLYVNTARAARTDAVEDTVNWSTVVQEVLRVCRLRHYGLIETLCESLAAMLLDAAVVGQQVDGVELEVHKIGCLSQGRASVRIIRWADVKKPE
jgi:dihydroneopterin aldolase